MSAHRAPVMRGRSHDLASAILHYAGDKNSVMRGPLRRHYELAWDEAGRLNSGERSGGGKRSTDKLKADLATLERRGMIQRHDAYVTIIDRHLLTRYAEGDDAA